MVLGLRLLVKGCNNHQINHSLSIIKIQVDLRKSSGVFWLKNISLDFEAFQKLLAELRIDYVHLYCENNGPINNPRLHNRIEKLQENILLKEVHS